MGPALSPPAFRAAYAPFTPNESGQRSPPTYYRGCWHVVSRGFFRGYRRCSSPPKAVCGPRAFLPHAASLRQACAHCAIFPTAASRRSLGRVSVPMRPIGLSARLPVESPVGRHPAGCLMGRGPIPLRSRFPRRAMRPAGGAGHYPGFPRAIPVRGAGCPRVTRPFAASCAPRGGPSPPVFLPISAHSTATPGVPPSPAGPEPGGSGGRRGVEPRVFTPGLPGRLRALYAQ